MIRKLLLSIAWMITLTAGAQETLLPDTALSLPPLNSLGQMHYINRWPMSYSLTGYHDWDLHSGLNVSLGASVLGAEGPGTSAPLFPQNVTSLAIFTTNTRNGIGEPYTDPGR